ncbi:MULTISPECIES: glycoside hydrolase family 10 protein [Actinomadura]|uniref:glycoside hydrolase family 10 protein n=1 Tax=Actinomadura TaxID=1988 RepID=UPI000552CD77|nr:MULTISPECIES: family 10 glycosylhydrolase [Actinomadura]
MSWLNRTRMAAAASLVSAGALAGCALTALGGDERAGSRAPAAGAPAECSGVPAPDGAKGRELRGIWIATVGNIDWPKDPGASAAEQKKQYTRLLDRAAAMNMNAVFVQIRPNSDAFYDSPHEPWSQWITGEPGKDPGYDVLDFLLKEAHARNLEFHAWFNPYRVSRQTDLKKLAPDSPARRNPAWVREYGDGLWYDPGVPEVRELVTASVLDVVNKYDIDAVHFDDYFYPYPEDGAFPDQATHRAHGKGQDLGDWRRANVNTLVRTVSEKIHAAKPHVRFGISPFGVWRNATTDPAGSDTRALQSHDDVYADTRTWIKEGWVDYVTPQLYWPIGDPAADYAELVGWWSEQVKGTDVRLYIGQGAYRVGQGGAWNDPAELTRHLSLNAEHPEVDGDVYFSASNLMDNTDGFATRLRDEHYARPAIPPVIAPNGTGDDGEGDGAPAPAHGVTARAHADGVEVRWKPSPDAASHAVYRVDGEGDECAAVDPDRLIADVRGGGIIDPTAEPGRTYTYYVTAVDRYHRESPPARGATAAAPEG